MPPSTCCRKAKASAVALLMKVCILSTKCSKWKAALNSTLSVNLRWVWWKHSRCIFFPGITCFVNTVSWKFQILDLFQQVPTSREKVGIPPSAIKRNTRETKERHPKQNRLRSPQLDFCAPGVAAAVYFLQWLRRGVLWDDSLVWFLFLEPVFKVESPQHK